jgi:hypothetical protein
VVSELAAGLTDERLVLVMRVVTDDARQDVSKHDAFEARWADEYPALIGIDRTMAIELGG